MATKGNSGALCVLLISCSLSAQAENFLGADVARLTSQEVQQQFHNQLKTMLGQGGEADMSRLERLQAQLQPLFSAMPKSADGGLEHGTARYALHRFFAQHHGWHIRGLEAAGANKWSNAATATSMLEDHIPSYVLQLFEQSHSGRTGLRELAVLAATLEDVVHSEAVHLLSTAYAAQNRSTAETLGAYDELRILKTYLLFHTMPNPQYAQLNTAMLNRILLQAPNFWTAWLDMVLWAQDLRGTMDHWESSAQNPFVGEVVKVRNFNSIVRLVESVGEHYGQFQDLECKGMKHALLDMSDGSGRVRLAKFYQAAVENRTSHFSESSDYLRHLGVLDETDPRQPNVIVANYIYARANCVAASGLYSICCLDECEVLLAQLERDIANPVADPRKVAELVAAMPSDTVAAPRNISIPMLRRLDDIAGRHGGSVPLHGRLFAQWMHHAFPNECAYPHVSTSLPSPSDPLNVLLAEDETGLRLRASMEEMQSFVDAAAMLNASDPIAAAQGPPLPWTEEEELIVGGPVDRLENLKHLLRYVAMAVAISSALFGFIRRLSVALQPAASSKAEKGSSSSSMWGNAQKSDQLYV